MNKQIETHTRISVGTIIFKNNNILFGLAKDKEGNPQYILPVGHLEYMESFQECAKREVREESGIEIKNIQFQFISNTDGYKPKHYIHIGLTAEWESGEPEVLEEGGILKWEWIPYENMPENLSKGAAVTVKALREKKLMYDFVK